MNTSMTAGVFFFVFLAIASIITSRFQNLYLIYTLPRVFRQRCADLDHV